MAVAEVAVDVVGVAHLAAVAKALVMMVVEPRARVAVAKASAAVRRVAVGVRAELIPAQLAGAMGAAHLVGVAAVEAVLVVAVMVVAGPAEVVMVAVAKEWVSQVDSMVAVAAALAPSPGLMAGRLAPVVLGEAAAGTTEVL